MLACPPALAAALAQVQPSPDAAEGPGALLIHEVLDSPLAHLRLGPYELVVTKHFVFFLLAAAVVLLVARLALRGYRSGIPRGLAALVEMLVLFVRDEIAVKNIGEEGRRFTPLLCSLFFFILVATLLGLLPFAATSTANVSVTLALASVSFGATHYAGISRHGLVHHLSNMVPPGLPRWLLPIMVPVEVVGLLTKPLTLTIRLFANMLAGHVVVTALLMLIPLMAAVSAALGWLMVPVALGLALFIKVLELLVAFIQAYIFTLLTSIFIGMAVRPSH